MVWAFSVEGSGGLTVTGLDVGSVDLVAGLVVGASVCFCVVLVLGVVVVVVVAVCRVVVVVIVVVGVRVVVVVVVVLVVVVIVSTTLIAPPSLLPTHSSLAE